MSMPNRLLGNRPAKAHGGTLAATKRLRPSGLFVDQCRVDADVPRPDSWILLRYAPEPALSETLGIGEQGGLLFASVEAETILSSSRPERNEEPGDGKNFWGAPPECPCGEDWRSRTLPAGQNVGMYLPVAWRRGHTFAFCRFPASSLKPSTYPASDNLGPRLPACLYPVYPRGTDRAKQGHRQQTNTHNRIGIWLRDRCRALCRSHQNVVY